MKNLASPALLHAEQLSQDFPPTRRYLIGVSGGRDSVALLHSLVELGYGKLVVCHLDHQLRGRSSQGDARFVSRLAAAFGLACEIGKTDVRQVARQRNVSIETAARIARLAFFVTIARQYRCRSLFLAHHADDLVETALLNLFRGAGPAGISALREISTHRIGRTPLTIIRPMLHKWRSNIDNYVQHHQLTFREDASNAQLDARRNRIRHRALPFIEKQFGRDVRRSIWRAAQIWSEEDALLDSLLSPAEFRTRELKLEALRKLPLALQRRAIRKWLQNQHVSDISFDLIEAARSLLDHGASKINLPGNRHARRRSGRIFVE